MALTKRTRFEVLRRDNHACRYCGQMAPDVKLTVDHVIPVALGGSDKPDNLVAACKDCNAGKSSTSPDAAIVADVAQRAVLWAAAIERYNAIRLSDRRKRDAYVRRFDKAWSAWHYRKSFDSEERLPVPRPGDWKATMWQFYGLGLPIVEVEDAVVIACGNQMVPTENTFRYMCGVLWNKVKAMQDGANALIEAESGDA